MEAKNLGITLVLMISMPLRIWIQRSWESSVYAYSYLTVLHIHPCLVLLSQYSGPGTSPYMEARFHAVA